MDKYLHIRDLIGIGSYHLPAMGIHDHSIFITFSARSIILISDNLIVPISTSNSSQPFGYNFVATHN